MTDSTIVKLMVTETGYVFVKVMDKFLTSMFRGSIIIICIENKIGDPNPNAG